MRGLRVKLDYLKHTVRKHIVFLITVVLIISSVAVLVIAKGGGGNPSPPPPSPPPSSPDSSPSSSGSSSGGSGVYFYGLTCDSRGVIAFNKKPRFETVEVESVDDGTILKDIKGTWDGFKFTSDEATLLKAGKYMIRDPQTNDLTVDCPGLKFSCKLVELFIDECFVAENNDEPKLSKISAKFTLKNADSADLKYEFEKNDGKLISAGKTSRSSELKALSINKIENDSYSLEVPDAPEVKTLQIMHPECVGEYYVYSKIGCMKKGNVQKETKDKNEKKDDETKTQETGKKLKCGGYLDINDRVKCRISVREEQAGEWENFFPEECKAWKPETQPKCLEFYTSVRECWKFENGVARINCVKKQVKLGEILAEKANCNALKAEDKSANDDRNDSDNKKISTKEQCNKDLKYKINAVVKFRLYNLEEEAERWLEEGKIAKDDLVDFVVFLEKSKLEYNKAQNKEEKKALILKARKAWIELVKKIKE